MSGKNDVVIPFLVDFYSRKREQQCLGRSSGFVPIFQCLPDTKSQWLCLKMSFVELTATGIAVDSHNVPCWSFQNPNTRKSNMNF